MIPNAYLSVSVIQQHREADNDRPLRVYGVVPLLVEDPQASQQIALTAPDELRPGEDFTVSVQTGDRRPTQFVVAVVDEGLLDLTAFRTPNPLLHFFKKQRAGVATYDMYSHVIDAVEGDVFRRFSVGGGFALVSSDAGPQQRRFPPVVLFEGPVRTNARSFGSVTFRMPEYIGSVRVMAVAASGQRYRVAEQAVPVKRT